MPPRHLGARRRPIAARNSSANRSGRPTKCASRLFRRQCAGEAMVPPGDREKGTAGVIKGLRLICSVKPRSVRHVRPSAPADAHWLAGLDMVADSPPTGPGVHWDCHIEACWYTTLAEANDVFGQGLVKQVTLNTGSALAHVRAAKDGIGSTRAEAIDDCLRQFERAGLANVVVTARSNAKRWRFDSAVLPDLSSPAPGDVHNARGVSPLHRVTHGRRSYEAGWCQFH